MAKPPKFNTIMILFGIISFSSVNSQPEFQFSMQSWASYTTFTIPETPTAAEETFTQHGFGIRRARLRGKMSQGAATGFIQFEVTGGGKMMDARLDYALNDKLSVRMGRYVGAGSQAASRTGHTSIDLIERSIVGRKWGDAVYRSDNRTYGMSLMGKLNNFAYELMASNGNGGVNLKPYNYKSTGSDTETGTSPQLDFMLHSKLGKSIKTGIHHGFANKDRVNISSTTGYLYFKPINYATGNARFKLDFAEVDNKSTELNSRGYSLLGVYRLTNHIEVGSRMETWTDNTDTGDGELTNFTIGVNYSVDPDNWTDTMFKIDFTLKSTAGDDKIADPFMMHFLWQMYLH